MKKLFLGGGGSEEQSKAIDKEFQESLPKNPKILLIALARDNAEKTYQWFVKAYAPYGIKDVKVLEDKPYTKKEFMKYDAIYIGGGNTFKLLKRLKEKGITRVLEQYYRDGNIIYGGSAG
ncbi:MAG: Type 1 glutamine amidotransferase-like domain-containing protein, partial [Nanoarchaeota archaeon]